jgi:hypothetical protein
MHENRIRTLTEKELYSTAEVLKVTDLGRTKLFELLSAHAIESVRVDTRRPILAQDYFVAGFQDEYTSLHPGLRA